MEQQLTWKFIYKYVDWKLAFYCGKVVVVGQVELISRPIDEKPLSIRRLCWRMVVF